jgi:hypothetical protein
MAAALNRALIGLLTMGLTGCSTCRLTLMFDGDPSKPIQIYQFQPGVKCDF